MSKARLVITAVIIEKRPVSEVARSYGVARSWAYALLARYRAEGEAAFEPRSRPSASSEGAIGLGWQVNESRGVAGLAGYAHGAAASLAVKLDSGKVHVALTNRGIPIDEVNMRVLDALADS